MLDLKKVEKLLKLEIGIQRLLNSYKEEKTIEDSSETIVSKGNHSLVWSFDVLPPTSYLEAGDSFNLEQIEKISLKKIIKYKPRKMAVKISSLDLLLIKKVVAEDLVKYDGKVIPKSLAHIQNWNSGIFKWFIAEFKYNYLEKMAEKAVEIKDFNLLSIIIQAIQYRKLNMKQSKKLVHYKKIMAVDEGGISPFDCLLKDCGDSNINVSSEIASLRFCKIIDKLKQMKLLEGPMKIKEKDKQYLIGKAWKYLNYETKEYFIKKKEMGKLYLVI